MKDNVGAIILAIAIVIAATIIALSHRYEPMNVPGGIFILDSWSGNVSQH
jgi:hypothetical protein